MVVVVGEEGQQACLYRPSPARRPACLLQPGHLTVRHLHTQNTAQHHVCQCGDVVIRLRREQYNEVGHLCGLTTNNQWPFLWTSRLCLVKDMVFFRYSLFFGMDHCRHVPTYLPCHLIIALEQISCEYIT